MSDLNRFWRLWDQISKDSKDLGGQILRIRSHLYSKDPKHFGDPNSQYPKDLGARVQNILKTLGSDFKASEAVEAISQKTLKTFGSHLKRL